MINYFIRPDEEYIRNIDCIKDYFIQAGNYLHITTGKPIDTCIEFLRNTFKDKEKLGIIDPVLTFFERDEVGDSSLKQESLYKYITTAIKENDIVAPSLTTYIHPSIKKSLLSDFVKINKAKRNLAKKAAFHYRAIGNIDMYISKNNEQGTVKIYNNSLSGAFASNGTNLVNFSAHSTLTSTTRTVSSLGNAINEKIIAGSRHYWSYDTVINNINFLVTTINLQELEAVVAKYKLHIPTTDEVMECITYSTSLYWINNKYTAKIRAFVNKLNNIEKTAFLYISDLHHLKKHNNEFIRAFITELSFKDTTAVDDPVALVSAIDESVLNYASIVCSEEIKGKGKDYTGMHKDGVLNVLVSTALNIDKTTEKYKDFIRVIFATNTLPPSVAYVKNMVRRAVVLSDTDSTMFSTDAYVKWYFGEMEFSPRAFSIAGAVMFLTTQSISNGLRILSANINVSRDNLSILNMKPEFSFPVFAQTSIAKHYFASKTVQEGNVFAKPDVEIKGVHLISSAIPKSLNELGRKKILEILDTVVSNKKITIVKYLNELSNLETDIKNSILRGEVMYFKASKIKSRDSYAALIQQSPFVHHLLWDEVFREKYGQIDQIPYSVIKIPLALDNKTAVVNWLASINDREFVSRMATWLVKYKKETFPTIFINVGYVLSNGVPAEIIPIINYKKIILELTKSQRIILESLGVYLKQDKLVSELGY